MYPSTIKNKIPIIGFFSLLPAFLILFVGFLKYEPGWGFLYDFLNSFFDSYPAFHSFLFILFFVFDPLIALLLIIVYLNQIDIHIEIGDHPISFTFNNYRFFPDQYLRISLNLQKEEGGFVSIFKIIGSLGNFAIVLVSFLFLTFIAVHFVADH